MTNLFSDFNNNGNEFVNVRDKILERGKFDEWCESVKITSDTEKEFLKSWDGIGDVSESYQKWMIDNGKATSKAGSALKSFGATLASIAVNMAIAMTISAVIKLADELAESLEEQKAKLEDSKNSISDYKSQISDLENKLSENGKKIEELNSNPLDIVDQNTLSTLQEENRQLNEQLELVKTLNEEAKDIAENTTVQILENTAKITGLTDTLNKLQSGDIFGAASASKNGIGGFINAYKKFSDGDIGGGIRDIINGAVSTGSAPLMLYNWFAPHKENDKSPTEEAKSQIEEIEKLYDDLNSTDDPDDRNDIQSDITEKTTALLSNIKTLRSYKETLDPTDPEQSKWIQEIQNIEDAYIAMQAKKEDYNTFDKIINSETYADDKDKLIELAGQGKLTADVIENDFHNLFVLFNAIGLSTDDVIEHLKKMQQQAENSKEVEQTKPISFTKSWNKLGKESDEDTAKASEKAKEKLLELAEAGKLTTKAFEKSSVAKTILKETGLSAEEAAQKINKMKFSADQLSSMKTGISSISTILGEKKENLSSKKTRTKGIGVDTLAGMPEDIKAQTKEYEHFVEVLGDGTSSMEECRSAANKLATAYVNSGNFLSNLTAENEDYYISVLKEMGVENAAEVVTAALNRQKVNARIASFNLKNATKQEISTLGAYIKSLDDSSNSLAYYTLQQQIANNHALDTSDSIKKLKKLAKQCGITGEAIDIMSSLITNMRLLESGQITSKDLEVDPKHKGEAQAHLEDEIKGDKKRLNKLIKNGVKIKPTPKNTPQKPSDSKEPKSTDEPSKTIQTIDWIARRVTVLNTALETAKKNFDAIFTRKKVDSTADLVRRQNKNLNEQIRLQKQLEKANNKAAKKYNKQADKVGLSKKYKKLVNRVKAKGGYTIEDFVTTSSSSGKTKGKKRVSESTYDKIQKYIDYRDKAESARQNAIQARVERENARIQKLQNKQSRYDTLASAASAKQEYGSPGKRKEAAKAEWDSQNKSYNMQIKQAKLQKDTAKVKQLRAEKKNAKIANKVKQLEIDKDTYDTQIATYQAQQSNAKLKDTNPYVDKQIKATKESYALQIKIAKAQGNTALAAQLEAEAQKANIDLLQQKVDNVKAYYNAELGLLDNRGQQIQNQMDLVDARGDILSTDYYDKLSNIEKQRQITLNSELQNLEGKLSGFTEGTQEWYDLNNSIQETKNAIAQSQKQVYDNTTASRELRDKIYDLIRAIPQNLADEYSFLGELVRGENINSDTGEFTDAGLAELYAGYMGFSAVSSNIKMDRDRLNGIEDIYNDYLLGKTSESETLERAKANGYNYSSIEDLKKDIPNMRKQLQEDINNSKAYLDSIRDIVKEKMEAMVNTVSKAIEAHKELLNQEKALYDYQRQMLEKTKTISNIEKQMAALQGDDSEEGRARLAKLQIQLDEANQDLKDTEYDKYISDQEDMLDQLLKEYSDIMERLQKDEDYTIQEGFENVNTHLTEMQEIFNKISNAWSYPQSNDYKDSENDVSKDVNDGGIPGYNPGNIVTKPGQTEENKVTDTLDEKGKYYLDKLNGNSGSSDDNGNGNNSNNAFHEDSISDADINHQMRANTVDTGMASTGAFGPGATVADEKRYAAQARAAAAAANEKVRQNQLNAARSFIGANARKAKKDYKDLSYVNQKIYDATNGKVLSTENLKKLAKNTLKIEYDNAGKDGKLAKKLKEIRYTGFDTGFRTGGIVRANGRPSDGDHVPIRVNPNETILTQKFTDMLPYTVDVMESLTKEINVPDYSNYMQRQNNVINKATYGDVSFNFDLPNVTDARSLVKTIQSDKGVQNTMLSIVESKLTGGGSLSVNRFR